MAQQHVTYFRVSTAQQGKSGLGLDAQRAAALAYLAGRPVAREFVEVESGTGKRERPVLAKALEHCRLTGCVLLVVKLDRLARNVAFVSALMESNVDFVALDCPTANRFTIHILAAVAEHEAKLISERTRAALGAAKARGVKLGNPNGAAALRRHGHGHELGAAASAANADARARELAELVAEIRPGRSLAAIATELNTRGIRTPRGGQWHASSVSNLIDRIERAQRGAVEITATRARVRVGARSGWPQSSAVTVLPTR